MVDARDRGAGGAIGPSFVAESGIDNLVAGKWRGQGHHGFDAGGILFFGACLGFDHAELEVAGRRGLGLVSIREKRAAGSGEGKTQRLDEGRNRHFESNSSGGFLIGDRECGGDMADRQYGEAGDTGAIGSCPA